MVWDDQALDRLRELWAEGLSAAAIGAKLGCSKNAAIGKGRRIGLPSRPSPIKQADAATANGSRAIPRPVGATLPALASLEAPVIAVASTSLMERREADAAPVVKVPPRQVVASQLRPPVAPVAPPRPTAFRRLAACCWPIGEPGSREFRTCGDAARPGKPYCDTHCAKAYVRVVDRREQAA